ncbi:hypothetical protein PspLS_01579 [Pyricularia sp. CBS 133598]|nr:hypothetical protein PspLS_01579 [Pyricularia sp. CBS 133598]
MQISTFLTIAYTLSLAPAGVFAARGSHVTVKPEELDAVIASLEHSLAQPPCKVTIYAPPKGKNKSRQEMGFAVAQINKDVDVKIPSTGKIYRCSTDESCDHPFCHGLPKDWSCDGVNMHTFPRISLQQAMAQKNAQASHQ